MNHGDDQHPHERCPACNRWRWCARQTEEYPPGCDADEHGRREADKAAHPW